MLEFLKFNIGGYCGFTYVEAIQRNNCIDIQVDIVPGFVSERVMHLSLQESKEWSSELEAVSIGKWRAKYDLGDMRVFDGIQWELEYKECGKRCRHISGDNAYPDNWLDFLVVINEYVPLEVPNPINLLKITYQDKRTDSTISGNPEGNITQGHYECIVIDREKETLTYTIQYESGCETKHEYKSIKGVSELLDDLEECLDDSDYETMQQSQGEISFELQIYPHHGDIRRWSGNYNRNHLPIYWEEIIHELQIFISKYDNKRDIFNVDIYGRGVQANEFIYCTVNYIDSNKGFYYLTEDDSLQIGEKVIVPCGKNNARREAIIKKVEYFLEEDVPFPVDKTKRIIGRIQEHGLVVSIYDDMDYEKLQGYFKDLPEAKELEINKFQKQLYELGCIIPHYNEYLIYTPMNVGFEVKRIETVDLITAFAILTMVFREDHFVEGMLGKRVEDGTLDRIIRRIKALLDIKS